MNQKHKILFKVKYIFTGILITIILLLIGKVLSGLWHKSIPTRWNLTEQNQNTLLIPIDRKSVVQITRSMDSEKLTASVLSEDVGTIFQYKHLNIPGKYSCEYSGKSPKSELIWFDLDGDGQFDLKFDLKTKQTWIYYRGSWISAKVDNSHVLGKINGKIVHFVIKSGEWQDK